MVGFRACIKDCAGAATVAYVPAQLAAPLALAGHTADHVVLIVFSIFGRAMREAPAGGGGKGRGAVVLLERAESGWSGWRGWHLLLTYRR